MRLTYLVVFIFFFHHKTCDIADFLSKYKYEIKEAKEYYSEMQNQLKAASLEYNTDYEIIASIVFPELIRYSKYRDFLETTVLEVLYIQGGKEDADFSIGKFQMKPSFIEKMESFIRNNKTNFKQYNHICSYDCESPSEIRSNRLDRLKSQKWQLIYINCFYSIVKQKFKDIRFGSKEKEIRFFATAYNHGFDKSQDEINKWSKIHCFPYGFEVKNAKQYNYADISVYFYNLLQKE